jgi:hypothetical protein
MKRLLLGVGALLLAGSAAAEGPAKEPELAKVFVAGHSKGYTTTSRGDVVETVKVNLELANKTMLGIEADNVKEADPTRPGKNPELNTYVAEGALRVGDPWPNVDFPAKPGTKQLWLRGTGRNMIKEDQYKFPSKGNAIVEGTVVVGQYDLGDQKTPLAVQNGKDLIYVTGKAAKGPSELKGTIRVTGQLQLDEKGRIRIAADKIEANKK